MKILFSRHAKFRCMQRKIPEQWVEDLLTKIPFSPGKHEHLVEGTRLTVVYHDGDINRTVITLHANELSKTESKWKSNKHVKQVYVQDMIKKDKQRHLRRKNQLKKKKMKNKHQK